MKVLALLLLLGMVSLSVSEVVHSFKQTCPQFFFKDNNKVITPTVLKGDQFKQICQFYAEQNENAPYRFATLYDTERRIPVYSAYTYEFGQRVDIKDDNWKIEPQLDPSPTTSKEREMRRMTREEEKQPPFRKQAVHQDYESTYLEQQYTRGHVFPKSYALGDEQKQSTFTLTNAAPQTQESNQEWAEQVEQPMLNEIKGNCDQNSEVYIVTGVVPSHVWLPIKRGEESIEEGVNIPRYYWSAYSCKSNKNKKINISNAYISQQIIRTPKETTKFNTKNMTVDKLNKELASHYNSIEFSVFG